MTAVKFHNVFSFILNISIFIYFLHAGVHGGRIRRLVGGENATLDEIYYQASLNVDGFHICGGTIITPKHVLTAAHCVAKLFEPPFDELVVQTGTVNLKEGGDHHQVFNISWHPGYESGEFASYNDIAILTLRNEINVTTTQKPVNLPNFPAPLDATAVISGWGRTSVGSPYSARTLKKALVTILSHEECQKYHNSTIMNGQICGRASDKGVGICKGDSGGPLVLEDTIIGISSWAISIPSLNIDCGTGVPDVYTDVYQFLNFIKSIIHGH